MFSPEDLQVFKDPASWQKIDELGTIFFPKLCALKNEAAELIDTIYGIRVGEMYKTYQAPTPSTKRRKGLKFNSDRNSDELVLAGLRAKGIPSSLYHPNDKHCKMHFAYLAFEISYSESRESTECDNSLPSYTLSLKFSPYLLRYARFHREQLSLAMQAYELEELIFYYVEKVYFSHDLPLLELLKKDRAWIELGRIDVEQISIQDMASLVVAYAACFPLLDIFTRLSNGESLFSNENETLVPVEELDYKEKFLYWHENFGSRYTADFSIKPVTEEGYWRSEALTRTLFEQLVGLPFPKARPAWLRSFRSKASMELDGYCEVLNLAFEYQGEHHYMDIFRDQIPYQKIQENDKRKIEICQQNGVDLIPIPYFRKGDRAFVMERLQALRRQDIDLLITSQSYATR